MFQMRDRNTDRDHDRDGWEPEAPGHDPHAEPPESDDDQQAAEHDFWEEMERRHEHEEGGEG